MSLGAMPQHVDDGQEQAVLERPDHHRVSTKIFAMARADFARVFQPLVNVHIHLRTVTRVPSPGVDSSENSSIIRFTPGSPSPRVPPELKWSSIAASQSAMPGPSSAASI